MRHPRAPHAPARSGRPETCPGGKALRHRRRTRFERYPGPCTSSPSQAARRRRDRRDPHGPRHRLSPYRRQVVRRQSSLQLRLALRLAVVYLVATALAVGIIIYRAYDTAGTLNDRELSLRAQDLARAVSLDASGASRLDLPAKLSSAYA